MLKELLRLFGLKPLFDITYNIVVKNIVFVIYKNNSMLDTFESASEMCYKLFDDVLDENEKGHSWTINVNGQLSEDLVNSVTYYIKNRDKVAEERFIANLVK